MKRLLAILLVVALLAGCGKRNKKQSDSTDPTGILISPDIVTLYIPDSPVEQQTAGAVRTYGLPADNYFMLANMGDQLLLVGQNELTVLTGEQGCVMATLPTTALSAGTAMNVAATGVAYYDSTTCKVTVLNPHLQVAASMALPKTMMGSPCISIAKNEVFYSTGSELRAMNMTTGISRLVRQQTASTQELLGAYFDGNVLLCQITDAEGNVSAEYISAETGQTVANGHAEVSLQTVGTWFMAMWQDGFVQTTAFGIRDEIPQSLRVSQPAESAGGRAMLPLMHAVVDYTQTDAGLALSYYDLNTGKCTARTVLPGVQAPTAFCGSGNGVSLLATDASTSAQTLYRWDVTKSAVVEETVHTGPLYTAENPDTEGLAACRTMADDYQRQYGVKLLLWQDAIKVTGGYTLTPEYQPQVITQMLEKLQPVVAYFPEKFLQKTVEAGWIRIALVREIDGGEDWVQFWEDGDCWIILSAETDVAASVLQGIAYGIDSHVLGNSRELDTWSALNPKDFTYTYSAHVSGNSAYLSGDNRAFADMRSMTYPHEDRCRIFYYATLPDKADMFQSPVMQAKLLRLCKGIREAYNLQKSTETYIWEQYLTTPIAYVPK